MGLSCSTVNLILPFTDSRNRSLICTLHTCLEFDKSYISDSSEMIVPFIFKIGCCLLAPRFCTDCTTFMTLFFYQFKSVEKICEGLGHTHLFHTNFSKNSLLWVYPARKVFHLEKKTFINLDNFRLSTNLTLCLILYISGTKRILFKQNYSNEQLLSMPYVILVHTTLLTLICIPTTNTLTFTVTGVSFNLSSQVLTFILTFEQNIFYFIAILHHQFDIKPCCDHPNIFMR